MESKEVGSRLFGVPKCEPAKLEILFARGMFKLPVRSSFSRSVCEKDRFERVRFVGRFTSKTEMGLQKDLLKPEIFFGRQTRDFVEKTPRKIRNSLKTGLGKRLKLIGKFNCRVSAGHQSNFVINPSKLEKMLHFSSST